MANIQLIIGIERKLKKVKMFLNKKLKPNEFKENKSHRRLLNDTDILDLKRRVSKLPPDGNLTPFFAEKTLNESLNLTQQNTIGDDSINS